MKNIVNLIIIVVATMFACHIIAAAVTAATFESAFLILLWLLVLPLKVTTVLIESFSLEESKGVLLCVDAASISTWAIVLVLCF